MISRVNLLSAGRSAHIYCILFAWFVAGFLTAPLSAQHPSDGEVGERTAAALHGGVQGSAADGRVLLVSETSFGLERASESLDAGGEKAILPGVSGFRRSFNIPVRNSPFLLYASRAAGTIVGVRFSGSMDTNKDDIDAADAHFELLDLVRGIGWSVTGTELGWSGQGAFGPTESGSTKVFNGSIDLETDGYYFWESVNHGGTLGCIGCTATYDGHFIVTVEYPSPVALMASYVVEETDPIEWAPRDHAFSYVSNPAFTVDYFYDEEEGYWAEQGGNPCFDGDTNPTNFYLGIFNLTEQPVQACTFQASWDAQPHACSQAVLDVLNHPSNGRSVLIRTEDYVYVPDAACLEFTPTTVHALPGVTHWFWVEFVIDGIAYERRMYFVKQ